MIVREEPPMPSDADAPPLLLLRGGGDSWDHTAAMRDASEQARKDAASVPRDLMLTKEGTPIACLENIIRVFSRDGWAGCIVLDELLCRPVLVRGTPAHSRGVYPRWWSDTDDAIVCAWMQRELRLMVRPGALPPAVQAIASLHPFHPVRSYLRSLRWDGTPRLDGWLCDLFGVEDTPLTRAFAAMFLISAVARVMKPGEKADHMLILEGEQGLKKSSGLAALMPDPRWFLDDLGEIQGKDAAERLQGKWLIEVSELDALSRAEATRVKSFISRQVDDFRPAYGHWSKRFERQCVFAGTTNEDHYLKDATGGRRFWPVRATRIDLAGVAAQRDQLWAEALARYEDGAQWWLSEEQEADAREAQADRYERDVWHDRIHDFLIGKDETTVAEVLKTAIGVPPERHDRSCEIRVAKTLKFLGWRRVRTEVAGRREYVYRRHEG